MSHTSECNEQWTNGGIYCICGYAAPAVPAAEPVAQDEPNKRVQLCSTDTLVVRPDGSMSIEDAKKGDKAPQWNPFNGDTDAAIRAECDAHDLPDTDDDRVMDGYRAIWAASRLAAMEGRVAELESQIADYCVQALEENATERGYRVRAERAEAAVAEPIWVPREPTPEMITAGREAIEAWGANGPVQVWGAMYGAATGVTK